MSGSAYDGGERSEDDLDALTRDRDSIYFPGPDGERLELLVDKLGEMYGTKVL